MNDSTVATIDVLVLAGGLGSRLQGCLSGLPKPLAPVAGRPFLEHLLGWLSRQGLHRIVLALGHRAGAVLDYLKGGRFPSLEIVTVVEPYPLGTAGALTNALSVLHSDPILVMNGDTLIEASLSAFVAEHRRALGRVSMVCVRVPNTARYGRVEIDDGGRVLSFREKDPSLATAGWINAGVYLFGRAVLDTLQNLRCGSLERDVLAALSPGSIHAFRSESRFIDIGTPEDLNAAEGLFAQDAQRRANDY